MYEDVDEGEVDNIDDELNNSEARVTSCCIVDGMARDAIVEWVHATGQQIKPLIPNEPASTSKALRDNYPIPYFLYGATSSSDFLVNLWMLDQTPNLQRATLRGCQIKNWGPHKALVQDSSDSIAQGAVYNARSECEVEKLAEWMGFAYEAVKCDIVLASGEVIRGDAFIYWWEPSEFED